VKKGGADTQKYQMPPLVPDQRLDGEGLLCVVQLYPFWGSFLNSALLPSPDRLTFPRFIRAFAPGQHGVNHSSEPTGESILGRIAIPVNAYNH
jgi:hypothetical protein